MPIGMLGLTMLLVVHGRTGSYGAGGAVVAALGGGTCVGMVVQGVLVDRWGPRRVLLGAAVLRIVASCVFVSVAALDVHVGVLAGLAVAIGASEPQVSGVLRALWPSLVAAAQLPAAVALSSVLFELPVVAGPLIVAALVLVMPVEAVLLVAAGFAGVGAGIFALSGVAGRAERESRLVEMGRPVGRTSSAVLRIVFVLAVQGFVVGLVQVACAAAAGGVDRAAVAYAALGVGSLLGSGWAGGRAGAVGSRWQVPLLVAGLAAPLLAIGVGHVIVVVGALMLGLVAGPLSVRCFLDLARVAPSTAAGTAALAAGLLATSAGSAVCGWAVDTGGMGLAAVLGATTATVTAVTLTVDTFWRGRVVDR